MFHSCASSSSVSSAWLPAGALLARAALQRRTAAGAGILLSPACLLRDFCASGADSAPQALLWSSMAADGEDAAVKVVAGRLQDGGTGSGERTADDAHIEERSLFLRCSDVDAQRVCCPPTEG